MMFNLVKKVPSHALMPLLAGVIGVITGVLAHLLKIMIAGVSGVMTFGLDMTTDNPVLIALPVAGLLLTIVICKYVFKDNLAHGVSQLVDRLKTKRLYYSPMRIISPLVSSSVTLGMGGSAGAEGPIVSSGSAVGSNVARLTGVNQQQMMLLVGCGAGAGIAGIFTSPLGGAFFTLEVLRLPLSAISVLPIFIASISAGLVAYSLHGFEANTHLDSFVSFQPEYLWVAVVVGIVCGLYSLYYNYIMSLVGRFLNGVKRRWCVPVIAGLVIGLSLFCFPALYGEGYGVLTHALNGDFQAVVQGGVMAGGKLTVGALIIACLGIVVLKCFVTSATNNGGGVSGEYAPTLFAGCFVGLALSQGMSLLFGIDIPYTICILLAMSAAMSGIIKAPLMAIVIVSEMTVSYAIFLPLCIASMLSYGIVRLVSLKTQQSN
ncbi:MAG: chloride channel protein [Paramuribaculum sp.]|nr:chloride channel protein [Paramuribaculum sp.]